MGVSYVFHVHVFVENLYLPHTIDSRMFKYVAFAESVMGRQDRIYSTLFLDNGDRTRGTWLIQAWVSCGTIKWNLQGNRQIPVVDNTWKD